MFIKYHANQIFTIMFIKFYNSVCMFYKYYIYQFFVDNYRGGNKMNNRNGYLY